MTTQLTQKQTEKLALIQNQTKQSLEQILDSALDSYYQQVMQTYNKNNHPVEAIRLLASTLFMLHSFSVVLSPEKRCKSRTGKFRQKPGFLVFGWGSETGFLGWMSGLMVG